MQRSILFVDHSGVMGGGEYSLLDIAAHFRERATVVLLNDGPFRGRLEDRGVSVLILQAPASVLGATRDRFSVAAAPLGILNTAFRLARVARGYGLLYANSLKAMLVSALAGRIARRPVIWHVRDILSREHFGAQHLRLVGWVASTMVTRIIANSKTTAEAATTVTRGSVPVSVIHNAIDGTRFPSRADPSVRALRATLGRQGAPLVGMFGRIARWKGQDVFVSALALLPAVDGIVVGSPLFGEDTYERLVHDMARDLGIEDRIRFLGFREDVAALMAACDVVVHCSIAPEPFGRVIVEAMFAGAATVASAAGGPTEIVRDGETGILVKPGDPFKLAKAIDALVRDPKYAAKIRAAARTDADERFSLGRLTSDLENLVESVF